jgi:hypothetical protein
VHLGDFPSEFADQTRSAPRKRLVGEQGFWVGSAGQPIHDKALHLAVG